MTGFELRALGLGELLDRTVTVFVRHFGVIVRAAAIPYIPFAFAQWALLGPFVLKPRTALGRNDWFAFALDFAIASIVFAFARTATVLVADEASMYRSIGLRDVYRRSFARLGSQLLAYALAAVLSVLALATVAVPLAFVIGSLNLPDEPTTASSIVVVVVLAVAAVIAADLVAWVAFAYEVATVRIARGRGAFASVASAFRATLFYRPWRSLLAALVVVAIVAGGSLLFAVAGDLMPTPALHLVMTFGVSSAVSTLLEAFGVTFLTVYDIDLAVRREGLDITEALAVSAAPAASAPRG